MEPDTRLLRYFLAVADELNFTRAAKRLHIAQPSLSAQIRQLEAQLGVTLLHRTTRAVTLTEAGQALADRGRVALAGMEHAWEAARQAGRGEAGNLRMAYPLSAAHDTAPQLVQALHDAHPGIAVGTEVLPTPSVLLAVRDGRADIGIARAPAPMKGIRLRTVRHDEIGVLVAAVHPLAAETAVDLIDVAEYPVVLHPRAANPSHYDFIAGLFAACGRSPDVVEREIAFDLTQRLIADGDASTLVGRSTVAALPDGLRWLPLAERVAVTVALVLAAGPPSAIVERFEHVALAHASAQGWLG